MEDKQMYKERMLAEFEELVTRIAKATKRIEDVVEKDDLLFKQIEAMEEYKRILAIRILTEMNRY